MHSCVRESARSIAELERLECTADANADHDEQACKLPDGTRGVSPTASSVIMPSVCQRSTLSHLTPLGSRLRVIATGCACGGPLWATGSGLYYFAKLPNIEADLADVDGLRAFYRRRAC